MTNISGRFYRAADYFKDDLPIVVQHNIHSPADFDPPESLNRRQFWKILYIIDGTGLLKINHREYPFGPGFVCLNHPDDLTNLALDRPVELCNILFLQKTIENDLARLYNDNSFFSIFRPDFRPEQSLSHNLLHLIDSNRRIYLEIRRLHHEYTHTDANSGEMLRHMLVDARRAAHRILAAERARVQPQAAAECRRTHRQVPARKLRTAVRPRKSRPRSRHVEGVSFQLLPRRNRPHHRRDAARHPARGGEKAARRNRNEDRNSLLPLRIFGPQQLLQALPARRRNHPRSLPGKRPATAAGSPVSGFSGRNQPESAGRPDRPQENSGSCRP